MEKNPTKNKMDFLQNQIEKLKAQKLKVQKNFEKNQHAKIIALIKKENGFSHDFTVLVGALSEALKSLNELDAENEKVKAYQKIGEDFLRPIKKINSKPKNQKQEESAKNAA